MSVIFIKYTVTGETLRNSVLLASTVKNYIQISNFISIQAGFIGDRFLWKRTGLAKVGVCVKGIGSGQKRVKPVKIKVPKARVA